jgi:hypothetical protein
MAIQEGAWAVCVCISYTGDEGQLGCSFLWNGCGGLGWAGQLPKSYQMINEVPDRCDVQGGTKTCDGVHLGVVANDSETDRQNHSIPEN